MNRTVGEIYGSSRTECGTESTILIRSDHMRRGCKASYESDSDQQEQHSKEESQIRCSGGGPEDVQVLFLFGSGLAPAPGQVSPVMV